MRPTCARALVRAPLASFLPRFSFSPTPHKHGFRSFVTTKKENDGDEQSNTQNVVHAPHSALMPLESPPQGFRWVTCESIRTTLARPEEWYFSEDNNNSPISPMATYFVTKESLKEKGKFETGLTCRAYRNLDESLGVSPAHYASNSFQLVEMSHRRKLQSHWGFKKGEKGDPDQTRFHEDWAKITGKMPKCYGELGAMEYVEDSWHPDPSVAIKTHVRMRYFLNKYTQTLFEMVFESPEKNWKDTWDAHGRIMMSHFYFDERM